MGEIFLSVGRVSTSAQEATRDRLEAKLRQHGLEPKTIGRNSFTSMQPLDQIKKLLRGCNGVIALAFERTKVQSGEELRGIGKPIHSFMERRYCTPWHQIELAMGSVLSMPMLVVVEEGLHEEGLIEDKYGWYVYRTELSTNSLDSDEFNGILSDFVNRCKEYRAPKEEVSISELTIGQILRSMKVGQLWATLVALCGLAAGAFAIGAYVHPATTIKPDVSQFPLSSIPRPAPSAAETRPSDAATPSLTANSDTKAALLQLSEICVRLVDPGNDKINLFSDLEQKGYGTAIPRIEAGRKTLAFRFSSSGIAVLRSFNAPEKNIEVAKHCEGGPT